MVTIGVDLGGTNIAVGIVNEQYEIVKKGSVPTKPERGADAIVADMASLSKKLLAECNLTLDDVAFAGIATPGTANNVTGVVEYANNIPFLQYPLADKLSALLDGKPVYIENDANAAAKAEAMAGVAKDAPISVMITLGTGIGGGIIIDGKILGGAHGVGGEIGHLVLNKYETERCGCGKYGCAEQYASATGIVRMAKKFMAESDAPSTLRTIEPLTAKDVFDCAAAGDMLSKDILEFVYDCMGEFLADVCCICDPELVVIGGGVSRAGQVLLDGIARYFPHYMFHACKDTKFALATLGNDAGMYGCFRLVLEYLA